MNEQERKVYWDADTNPATAYELGRRDGRKAERAAILADTDRAIATDTELYNRAYEQGKRIGEAALAECESKLQQFAADTVEGFDCLPTCDSTAHDEHCPVAHPVEAWRVLRERLAECERKLGEIEEREAACCPEDVSFDEYIGVLTRKLVAARDALMEQWSSNHWEHCGYMEGPHDCQWPMPTILAALTEAGEQTDEKAQV